MNALNQRRREKGFTLVEMAIVLVIIGLILAAVSIGKDAQRNADYNRITQKFIGQWQQAYNEFYERNGVPVGDTPATPTLMVNKAADALLDGDGLVELMEDAGIKLPSGSGGSDENKAEYVYLDHNGLTQRLTVGFRFEEDDDANACRGILGNVMVLTGLTPELAKMVDQRVDGILNPKKGVFRATTDSTLTTGDDWPVSADEKAGATVDACWKMTN